MVDVLVAITQSSRQTVSSWRKISAFAASCSNTASTTTPRSAMSAIAVVVAMRPSAGPVCSAV